MDERLLGIFQQQVKSQCEFALMAADDINAALAAKRKAMAALSSKETSPAQREWQQTVQDDRAATDRLWFSLNAFLNAVANVSKLLWPNPKRKRAKVFPNRGDALRRSLGVDENSPLQHREVRNHFEHVDERYEEWWLKSKRHNIAMRTIGPLGQSILPLDEQELFEQFDEERLIVAFQGDVFELQPIADEISNLLGVARDVEAPRLGFRQPDA